jgi:hypothetical protein
MANMARKVNLPAVPKLPFDPPSPDNSPPGTPYTAFFSKDSTKAGNGVLKSKKSLVLVGVDGKVLEDGGLSRCHHRAVGEVNERVVETRRRALHGTAFERGDDMAVLVASVAVRVDDPLSDPSAEAAFGWLKRLETQDRGLRLLAFNLRAMQSLALLFRETAGETWAPRTWPAEDASGRKSLPGVEVDALGSVGSVSLPSNNLAGVLPRDLTKGWLALRELNLSGNRGLQGPLPGAMVNAHKDYMPPPSSCSIF